MSQTSPQTKDRFTNGNMKEVAAMITFIKTPDVKANYNSASGLLAQLLDSIENTQGLIIRRPWFNYDKMAIDDFRARVKKTLLNVEDALETFRQIQNNEIALNHTADVEGDEDEILAELNAPDFSFYDLDLTRSTDPNTTLQTQVPFMKLQKFLVRAYKATEERGTAQMTHVRFASAPRFENSKAPVRQFFDLEQ